MLLPNIENLSKEDIENLPKEDIIKGIRTITKTLNSENDVELNLTYCKFIIDTLEELKKNDNITKENFMSIVFTLAAKNSSYLNFLTKMGKYVIETSGDAEITDQNELMNNFVNSVNNNY